jgi:1-aminocyclopropane-1-carboxylate deaminase/D-cysteine desulfhydrase-like pyridoxal-dependent ACC family enzyme
MFEIGDDERKVLLCLIHAETPITVMEDTGIQINVTVYIKAIGKDDKVLSSFDIDKIRKTRFQLTAKGFDEISG